MFNIKNKEFLFETVPIRNTVWHYRQSMPEFVWSDSSLENNPFSFVEVKTLLDGITVGGHKLSDMQQILNLKRANELLIKLVLENKFELNKETFCRFNEIVAFEEALEWGCFRGEGQEKHYTPYVNLGETVFQPISTENNDLLNQTFENGLQEIEQIGNPVEKSFLFFLFGSLNQFFFDGNKRSSRYVMNGILMSNGLNPVSIPVNRKQEFNEKMIRFYQTEDGNEMFDFLLSCATFTLAPKPNRTPKMRR